MELIGGCVNTQRPEITNSQSLAIINLVHETYKLMPLIISPYSALNFKKFSVWQKIVLLISFMTIQPLASLLDL